MISRDGFSHVEPNWDRRVDPQLDMLLAEIAARVKAGRDVDVEHYARQYPDQAARLREAIPAIETLAKLGVSDMAGAAPSKDEALHGYLGDYRILREVGRGGMGVVYEAEQVSLGRRVALKVLPFAGVLDPRRLQRFQNEARAAACLHHNHIVPIFSVGCERGVHYYAMQFIEGKTLGEVIATLQRRTQQQPSNGPSVQHGQHDQRKTLDGGTESDVAQRARQWEAASTVFNRLSDSSSEPQGEDAAEPQVSGRQEAESDGTSRLAVTSKSDSAKPNSAKQDSGKQDSGSANSGRVSNTDPIAALSTENSPRSLQWCRSVAQLAVQVAEALDHAHLQGVIHRDVKPSNLLIDNMGKAWVTDFGLAHIESSSTLTVSGDMLGTLRYMSPEQASGDHRAVDHRTDIYSLAVTLYELLALQPAFPETDRRALFKQIVHSQPAPLRSLNPVLPRDLETIIHKAMAKDAVERYTTAGELAADLRRFLADEPIKARRPTPVQKLTKWARRHVAAVIGIAAFCLLLAASLTVFSALLLHHDIKLQAALEHAEESQRREAHERTRAEARTAEAESIISFVLEKILAAAQPAGFENSLGRDVTLAEAIEAALPLVASSFPDQPLVEARLRLTLGDSFLNLGEPFIAAEQYEAAHAIYSRHLSSDDIMVLGGINGMANAYRAMGRYEDAVNLHRDLVNRLQAQFGEDHASTLIALNNLAISLARTEAHSEAVEIHELVLRSRIAELGEDHVDTAQSMNNLANGYMELGRFEKAVELWQSALDIQSTQLGQDHPLALTYMSNLSNGYAKLGRDRDALDLREAALSAKRAALGDDHPRTLDGMNRLANSYDIFARYQEAKELREQVVELQSAKFGDDNPITLASKNSLANSYALLGRNHEALELREAVLAEQRKVLGPDHRDTLMTMHNMAKDLGLVGRAEEALELLEAALVLQREKLGKDHPETLLSMHNLAHYYRMLGQTDEARRLYEETLELQMAIHGMDHVDTLWTMTNLAIHYNMEGRYQEAIDLCQQIVPLLTAKLGIERPETLKVKSLLANSYLSIGRVDAAVPLLEEVIPIQSRIGGPTHSETLWSISDLANALLLLGRDAEALTLIDDNITAAHEANGQAQVLQNLILARIRHFHQQANVHGCQETAEMWEQLGLSDPDSLFVAALLRSLSSSLHSEESSSVGETDGDRAVTLLREALAAGFDDVEQIRNHPGLDSLRQREDFQQLLAELEDDSP